MSPTRSLIFASLTACTGTGGGATAHLAWPLRDLALGHENACAVDADGDVACWGDAGLFPEMESFSSADSACLAPFVPDPNDDLVCLTDGPVPVRMPAGEKFVDASVRLRGLALTESGHLVGFPVYPADCTPPCNTTAVVSGDYEIATFDLFDVGWCAVTTTGEGLCAYNLYDPTGVVAVQTPIPIPGGHVFTALSTSAFDYVGLDADGIAWRGQFGMASGPTFVVMEPSQWTDKRFTQVEVGTRYYQSFVLGVQNAGPTLVCGLEQGTGTVWCDGPNEYGERGTGQIDPLGSEPASATAVVGLPPVDEIAVATSHACARAGGEVWCWGLGHSGQLGYAASEQCSSAGGPDPWECSSTPARASVTGAVRIDAGIQYTCAEIDHDVVCWGLNNKGRLGGPGPDSQDPLPIGG